MKRCKREIRINRDSVTDIKDSVLQINLKIKETVHRFVSEKIGTRKKLDMQLHKSTYNVSEM